VVLSRLWLAAAFAVAAWVAPLASATPGTVPTGQPPKTSVIERELANALAKSRTTLVLRVHKHGTGTPQYVTAVEWVDLATGDQRRLDYDASGRLLTVTSRSYSGKTTGSVSTRTVTVAYGSKTWSATTGTQGCGSAACTAAIQALCSCDLDPFTDYGTAPPVSLLGQPTIDQHPTFQLRFTITGGPLASTTDIWIDRSTYLPVREKVVVPQTSVKNSPPPHTVTNDFTWLPRTRANLALLTLVVPPSFKQI
jgi:hypothetical protein